MKTSRVREELVRFFEQQDAKRANAQLGREAARERPDACLPPIDEHYPEHAPYIGPPRLDHVPFYATRSAYKSGYMHGRQSHRQRRARAKWQLRERRRARRQEARQEAIDVAVLAALLGTMAVMAAAELYGLASFCLWTLRSIL